jgi:predicted permease
MNDLKFAWRQLTKSPGFTLVAVLTLALGIGANTAIFNLINEFVLRPLAVKDPGALYALVLTDRTGDFADQRIPYPICQDYREQNQVFSDLLAYANVVGPTQVGGQTRFAAAQLVSANFFATLGIAPVLGRTFAPEENQGGVEARAVVLSYACWQSWFNGDPAVIGRVLTLRPNYTEPLICTIIGVAPAGFSGLDPQPAQLWAPARLEKSFKNSQPVNFRLVGRLARGTSVAQAGAALDSVAHNIADKYKGAVLPGYENEGVFRSDLKTQLRHAALGNWGAFRSYQVLRRATALGLGVAGFVLLIACANISNLLLARAEKRRREIAIRVALGAKRRQIVRQLLTESLLLSTLGGSAGMLFAVGLNHWLVALKPPEVELLTTATVDHRVASFTLLVALLAGFVFGTIPAWQAAKSDVNSMLKGDSAASEQTRGWRLRDLLAAGQIALSLVLLIGAGLCLRSFAGLQSSNPGFNVRDLVLVPLEFKNERPASIVPAYEELAQHLESRPGIRRVTYTTVQPMLGGGLSMPVQQIEGYTPQKDEFVVVEFTEVGPRYFETMGIPVVQTASQPLTPSNSVVWVNESFARRYWPGLAPLGKRVGPWVVQGLVKDSQIKNLTDRPGPYLYVQRLLPSASALTLVIQTDKDARGALGSLRSELARLNGDLDLSRLQSMQQIVRGTLVRERFMLLLLGGFAVSATVLAALGIYGVMSYLVTQRTRDLGIRIALGAQSWSVLGLVLGRGMRLTLVGVIVGLLVALATTRLLSSVLYGISPTDPLTLAVISLLLTTIALLACWIPARRASKIDPLEALRCE